MENKPKKEQTKPGPIEPEWIKSMPDTIKAIAVDFELLQHELDVPFPPPPHIELPCGTVPGLTTVRIFRYKFTGIHRDIVTPSRNVAVYSMEEWYDEPI